MDDEVVNKLMEEHKDDFISTEESIVDEGNASGGDRSQDKPEDALDGTKPSDTNNDAEQQNPEDKKDEEKTGADKVEPIEPDDSEDASPEPVGEKKDANSRIRQLIEEKKAIEFKLAEKEEAERKEREAKEDPVYTVDDFIGTADENGDPLTDTEAKARFNAWNSDYKLRQFQKEQVLKDQQNTLIELQRQTSESFKKFPEFDMTSDKYDEKLAGHANRMFEAGLEYDKEGRVIGSKIKPAELLEELHNLYTRTEPQVTKVNNLGDDTGPVISSQQIANKVNKYAPGFRGEVDKELDNLIKKGK